jgi:hypothetical protein
MISQLTRIDLKRALAQEGCPICRLRAEAEERYLGHVLWENVNDLATRARFLPSWGYCVRHAGMLGGLELNHYHDAMGSAIMYESLIQQLKNQLDQAQAEAAQSQAPGQGRIFGILWSRAKQVLTPLAPTAGCYVCQIGKNAAENILECLLEGLAGKEANISDLYQASDGLCLPHLRSALAQNPLGESQASRILVEHVQKYMAVLQTRLSEYIRKHGWDSREERITPEEHASWRKAIAFFSGGFLEDVPSETAKSKASTMD